MSKYDFRMGDLIEVVVFNEENDEDYYSAGDKGVIIGLNGTNDCFVDFNNQGNNNVFDDGKWYVEYDDIKLISRGEV